MTRRFLLLFWFWLSAELWPSNGRAIARADFEDRMVKETSQPGVTVVQSYTLMPRPDATPINLNDVRGYVHDLKFDAIIVSRMVKREKKTTYVPGDDFPFYPYYETFYGYYDAVAPIVYDPGYLRTDTEAQVETNFYSTSKPDGELIWSGTTDTLNPSFGIEPTTATCTLGRPNLEMTCCGNPEITPAGRRSPPHSRFQARIQVRECVVVC